MTASVYQTYGRRRSRSWSERHQQVFVEDLPRYALSIEAIHANANLQSLFPAPVEDVWVEIGFGSGEHLVGAAQVNPRIGYLGAEVYESGVIAAMMKLKAMPLPNVRIFPSDGRRLLDSLPDKSLNGIVLLFPDPWPKARHEKRQMMSEGFVENLHRLLKPAGIFQFASDAAPYVEKVLSTLALQPAFSLLTEVRTPDRPAEAAWPVTRYEKKAISKGRICTYLQYIYSPEAPLLSAPTPNGR